MHGACWHYKISECSIRVFHGAIKTSFWIAWQNVVQVEICIWVQILVQSSPGNSTSHFRLPGVDNLIRLPEVAKIGNFRLPEVAKIGNF